MSSSEQKQKPTLVHTSLQNVKNQEVLQQDQNVTSINNGSKYAPPGRYDILQLQRMIGNHNVGRILQRSSGNSSKEDNKRARHPDYFHHNSRHPEAIQRNDISDLSATPALIIHDSAREMKTGQMKKSDFLDQLYQSLYKVGTEEYQGSNLTVEGCPYIAYWFERYREKDVAHIERAARKYASVPPSVVDAQELIQLVCVRARKGFQVQVQTGSITELPADVPVSVGEGIPEPDMIVQRQPAEQMMQRSIEGPPSSMIQRGCLFNRGNTYAQVEHDIENPQPRPRQNNGTMVVIPQGEYKELSSGEYAFFNQITSCTAVYVRSNSGRVVIYHWPFTALTQGSKQDMRNAVDSIDAFGNIELMILFTKSDHGLDEFENYLRETYEAPIERNMVEERIEPMVRFDGTRII